MKKAMLRLCRYTKPKKLREWQGSDPLPANSPQSYLSLQSPARSQSPKDNRSQWTVSRTRIQWYVNFCPVRHLDHHSAPSNLYVAQMTEESFQALRFLPLHEPTLQKTRTLVNAGHCRACFNVQWCTECAVMNENVQWRKAVFVVISHEEIKAGHI